MILLTLVITLGWAAIHVFSARWLQLESVPRSIWLSMAGGVSVAYVFIHLLPEIAAAQAVLRQQDALRWLSHHAYLVALVGLCTFYGLDQLARRTRRAPEAERRPAFWLHVGSFAIYNGLVAYLLLHREETGILPLAYYAVALGLHFVVTDHGLREHHREQYQTHGRWVLAGALLVGWAISTAVAVPESWLVVIFAFLAGGVVLNVLKEELPEDRQSRFWAFMVGAGVYAVLLVAL